MSQSITIYILGKKWPESHINRVEKFDFVQTPRKIHHSKELEKLNKMI